jgi:hypothetical protein
MVRGRLRASPYQRLVEDADRIAWLAMRSSTYQNEKKRLHLMVDVGMNMKIPIPTLSAEDTYLDLGIVEGTLIVHGYVSRSHLRACLWLMTFHDTATNWPPLWPRDRGDPAVD